MKIIGIDGYNSYLGNSFYKDFSNRNKIYRFKKNIKNINQINKFIHNKKINIFIRIGSLSRHKCISNPNDCFKINYLANKKLIDQFKKNKNIKLIFISSSHVYSYSKLKVKENSLLKPSNIYGKYKLKSENYIKKNLNNYLIIRVFNIYGKNQPKGFFIPDIKNKILNSKPIKINNSFRDFIHVKEVSRFINFSIKKNINGIVNLGSGKSTSLISLIKNIHKIYKIKPQIFITNKKDKLVSNNSKIKKLGFNVKKYKNFNI